MDPDGNLVVIERLRHSDPSKYDASVAVRVNLMLIEGWIREHGTVPGFILVFDQKLYGLSHLARVSPMQAKRALHFVQVQAKTWALARMAPSCDSGVILRQWRHLATVPPPPSTVAPSCGGSSN